MKTVATYKKQSVARTKGIFIDEICLSLIFFETTEDTLFPVLVPYAKRVLKRAGIEEETQISALDLLGRAGREYCTEDDLLSVVYHPSSYLIGSIALETLLLLFPEILLVDRISRKRLSKYLQIELITYEFLHRKISENFFVHRLKRTSLKVLSLTCWRISRIMNASKKGRRTLKNNDFFHSDIWGTLIAQHGERGIFYGKSEIINTECLDKSLQKSCKF